MSSHPRPQPPAIPPEHRGDWPETIGPIADRCLSSRLALLGRAPWLRRLLARRHQRRCSGCRSLMASVDRAPLLPASLLACPSTLPVDVLRWLLIAATLLTHGCTVQLDAPCKGDDACLAAGQVCFDGRCSARPCAEGDVIACAVAAAGECPGTRTCVDGAFGPCVGPAERCNGRDDDCDGALDEEFVDLGEPCAVGAGLCVATGRLVCADDGMTSRCDAPPAAGSAEACNGADDDCDGRVDEQLPAGEPCTRGEGACAREGHRVCASGVPMCDAVPGEPKEETCNGVDDDCDGVVDDVAGLGERCAVGVGICAAEGVTLCGAEGLICGAAPDEPGVERCHNLLDDDCDGRVDDPLACAVACGNGRRDPDEGCDDGNLADGDGCDTACRVEPGYACEDGPADVRVAIDGEADCGRWRIVDAAPWAGGYGAAYAGGAIGLAGAPARYTAAYAVRTTSPQGESILQVAAQDDQSLVAPTFEEAEALLAERFDPLPPGEQAVLFPAAGCGGHQGTIEVELRTLDRCRRRCLTDIECLRHGLTCVEGLCDPRPVVCGDRVVAGGEACDDGNRLDGDGCAADCTIEPGAVCGDVAARFGQVDFIRAPPNAAPRWAFENDGRYAIQRTNSAPTHCRSDQPISPGYVTRLLLRVGGDFDDDALGWTIGGGPRPLTAPESPYLLFSWRRQATVRPDGERVPAGFFVDLIDGPPTYDDLFLLTGPVERLAAGRTRGDIGWAPGRDYIVEVVGDSHRLQVFVDGDLEFELADAPIGDGLIGAYNSSLSNAILELLGPATYPACTPAGD